MSMRTRLFLKANISVLIAALGVLGAVAYQVPVARAITDPAAGLSRIEQKGLVPCGGTGQAACRICDIFKLAKNITDFIVYAGFFITAAAIGIGGFMILAGAYSEDKVKQGKETLTAAIVGLIIILFAWFIVDTAIKVLVGDISLTSPAAGGFKNVGPWNAFQCENFRP